MIALLGYGKTNQALLEHINRLQEKCVVFDDTFEHERKDAFGNLFLPSKQEAESHLQIPSPGIPPHHLLIQKAKNLVSEYDFLLDRQMQVWVSGTNGKTTTTEMLEWILRDFGGKSGGNIGIPLATLALQNPQIWILETSSFTLHYTQKAFPKVYLLLPIKDDHIVWHGSFENYVADKLSPLSRMQSDCVAIVPQELKEENVVQTSSAKIIFYETSQDLAKVFGLDCKKLNFQEPFLLDALMALAGAKILFDIDLSSKLLDYKIGEHRMERCQDRYGRVWIDDSKGTNVDATIWALRTYKNQKIFLILGGDDKGADLTPLFEELKDGYKIEVFGIGSNALKLQQLCEQYGIAFCLCCYLIDAIEKINPKHSKDSVAILSPAAASLDQFSSYKERGRIFQEKIKKL